jgi:hypothetical protein
MCSACSYGHPMGSTECLCSCHRLKWQQESGALGGRIAFGPKGYIVTAWVAHHGKHASWAITRDGGHVGCGSTAEVTVEAAMARAESRLIEVLS